MDRGSAEALSEIARHHLCPGGQDRLALVRIISHY